MKKRLLALVLTAAMLLGMIPMLGTVSAEDEEVVTVLQDGQPVKSVVIPQDGETLLTGSVTGAAVEALNWQIKLPDADIWVNIDGYTAAECSVSYALVGSMLDSSGTAYLRLSAASSGGTHTSEAVAVFVTDPMPEGKTVAAVYSEAPAAEVLLSAESPAAARNAGIAVASLDVAADPVVPSGATTIWDVTVQFLYPDGTAAIQPFMAKIGDGEDLMREIVFAPVAGYAPYFDSDNDGVLDADDTTLEPGQDGKYHFYLNETNVERTLIFHIRFRPIEVDYKVEHYIQGLDNSYTLLQTDAKRGLTNEPVPAGLSLSGGAAVGHTPQEYARVAIAADGSTVVKIYYLINYYLINFALGSGAFGVEPVYVRYGTAVTVGRPTRPGYGFAGWDLVEVDGVEASQSQKQTHALTAAASGATYTVTVPAANLRYQAMWEAGATSYTVVYWRETETAVGYTGETKYEYWGSETVGGTYGEDGHLHLDNSVHPGEIIDLSRYAQIPTAIATTADGLDESFFFHYNEEKTTENGVHTVSGDGTTVVNVYFDRNVYTLKYYYAAKSGSSYYVFGRTNYFGTDSRSQTNRNDEISLLNGVWSDSFEKQVDSLPEILNSEGRYVLNSETSGDYTYYYFTFQAKYGADISKYWPTTEDISPLPGGYNGQNIVFSAWNGEYNVHYTQQELALNKDNETIKGQYRRLDHRVLWDTSLAATSNSAVYQNTVSYLAYWCNTAGGWTASWNIPSLYRYNIYLECLSQHSADTTCDLCKEHGPKSFTVDGEEKTYYRVAVYDVADNQDTRGNGNLQKQSHPDVYGFTNVNDANGTNLTQDVEYTKLTAGTGEGHYNSDIYQSGYEIYHFYDRNRYGLEFYNMGEKLQLKDANDQFMDKVSVRYGVSLYAPGGYDISNMTGPDGKSYYPENLPEDAYVFEGWYTSPTFAASAKFEFGRETTMPAANVAFYAHWVPRQFKVQIYKDIDAINTGTTLWSKTEADGTVRDYTLVNYGERAPTPSEQYTHTQNENLQFTGWFYLDEGEEKAWNFDSMTVTQDMQIYGKWISNQVKTYTVKYVLLDADGQPTDTEVAAQLTGSELVGQTVTLTAKAGSQLYGAYREHYFILGETSHNMAISENDAENIYTFYYVQAVSVPYTVHYVDENGTPIAATKEVSINPYSIVTEVFQVIPGYLPDAYSKRLVVSADEDAQNEITFVYTANETDAYYRIEHYVQAESGDGYILYRESQAVDRIGSSVSVELLNMTGFTFKNEKTAINNVLDANAYDSQTQRVSAVLTDQGLLFQLYYDRQELTYTVYYREYGTEKDLADAKTVTVRYGVSAVEQGISIQGYDLITAPITQIITQENIAMVFHYQERNATIRYVAKEHGRVDIGQELVPMVSGKKSEEMGSTPTAEDGYHFSGWYKNAACTIPVDEAWVDAETDKITPQPVDGYFEEMTYYALFVHNTADLTISTDFPAGNAYRQIDGSQTFVFRISGQGENADISLTVTLHERESKTIADLPTGIYTVTELSSSAWRYSTANPSQTVEVRSDRTNQVSFLETRGQSLWLDGNAVKAVNIFTPITNRKREGGA